jgi:transposase-like protein
MSEKANVGRLYALGRSVKSIAETLDRSRWTIHNWLKTDEEVRGVLAAQRVVHVTHGVDEAYRLIKRVIDNPEARDADLLKCSDLLMRHARDYEQRMANLHIKTVDMALDANIVSPEDAHRVLETAYAELGLPPKPLNPGAVIEVAVEEEE